MVLNPVQFSSVNDSSIDAHHTKTTGGASTVTVRFIKLLRAKKTENNGKCDILPVRVVEGM